jgi:hypothetical protein
MTEYGPGEIIANGTTSSGAPGYYVIVRKRECHTWVWKGTYVYLVVAKESESE